MKAHFWSYKILQLQQGSVDFPCGCGCECCPKCHSNMTDQMWLYVPVRWTNSSCKMQRYKIICYQQNLCCMISEFLSAIYRWLRMNQVAPMYLYQWFIFQIPQDSEKTFGKIASFDGAQKTRTASRGSNASVHVQSQWKRNKIALRENKGGFCKISSSLRFDLPTTIQKHP